MINKTMNKYINQLDELTLVKLVNILKKYNKKENNLNNIIKYNLPIDLENLPKNLRKRKRNFTSRQRKILLILGSYVCSNCGVALKSNFHADHVIPFSKGGKTILKNGQSLCAKCNLKKGAKYEKN